jgi:hypothetical protein
MPMPASKAEHGTLARYKKHQRDFQRTGNTEDKACAECREANRVDGEKRRDGRPAHRLDQARKRAESRAMRRLTRTFPVEYFALYEQELKKEEEYIARTSE